MTLDVRDSTALRAHRRTQRGTLDASRFPLGAFLNGGAIVEIFLCVEQAIATLPELEGGMERTVNSIDRIDDASSRIARISDLLGVVDALYRFAEGQDRSDHEIFVSAFAPDATVDFTDPALRFGVEIPPFKGIANISETILSTVASLNTTHTVTNPRVTLQGNRATLHALVEAQHLPKNDHSRHLLLKNIYTVQLSRAGEQWVINQMLIANIWFTGDPTVLFPPAP